MRTTLGQPLIVENVPGATGTTAIGRVVRAAADGHTLNIGNWTTHAGAQAIYPVQYDILKDIAPVSLLPKLVHRGSGPEPGDVAAGG
jgi:tripartite-type tricarboxylate transporter receptor subunit TctC